MRVTKQKNVEFDYMGTIHRINKMNKSPQCLLEKPSIEKNKNTIKVQKSPKDINIPIKVQLALSPKNSNNNFEACEIKNKKIITIKKLLSGQESKINSSSDNLPGLKGKLQKTNTQKNNNDSFSSQKNEDNKTDNTNNNKTETDDVNLLSPNTNLLNNQGDINQLKNLLITPKDSDTLNVNNIKTNRFISFENKPKNENNNNINFDIKVHKPNPISKGQNSHKIRNLLSNKFAYTKSKKLEQCNSPFSVLTQKNSGSSTLLKYRSEISNTEDLSNSESKSYFFNPSVNSSNSKKFKISNSPKITNYININIGDKKNYALNTYMQKNQNINDGINSSFNECTFSNNVNYNFNNDVISSPKISDNSEMIFDIKLEDLIILEERLNDISIALNNINSVNDVGACNECIEFFAFYFHSTLKNVFPLFFNGPNKVIIKSAVNLKLLTIIITYHLSMNPSLIIKAINELKNIFGLARMNLYLIIKKAQLFYGEAFTQQNEMYFKTFNAILKKRNLYHLNETQIIEIVNENCLKIVNNLNIILKFYQFIENNYYSDFIGLFNSISKITEKDLNNYLYTYLLTTSSKQPIQKYSNININNISKKKIIPRKSVNSCCIGVKRNSLNNNTNISIGRISANNIDNSIISTIKQKASKKKIIIKKGQAKKDEKDENKEIIDDIIFEYQKNKISPPFITIPTDKKYTLILDLDETLIHVNSEGQCLLRPGLFSFLGAVKPLYELISFTNASKPYSDAIIKKIETRNKYFDYNLYREHSFLRGKEFIKDISRIGRDIRKMIIVDNMPNNYRLNSENGINISPFLGDSKGDTVLFELKKLLIMFHKIGYDDIRMAIKEYQEVIKEKITCVNDNND